MHTFIQQFNCVDGNSTSYNEHLWPHCFMFLVSFNHRRYAYLENDMVALNSEQAVFPLPVTQYSSGSFVPNILPHFLCVYSFFEFINEYLFANTWNLFHCFAGPCVPFYSFSFSICCTNAATIESQAYTSYLILSIESGFRTPRNTVNTDNVEQLWSKSLD